MLNILSCTIFWAELRDTQDSGITSSLYIQSPQDKDYGLESTVFYPTRSRAALAFQECSQE